MASPPQKSRSSSIAEGTTLVGSGGQSADDWLIRNASRYPKAWLVTSDRALRAAAGKTAERVVGGGSFLRELDG